jgi:hypothetical protein
MTDTLIRLQDWSVYFVMGVYRNHVMCVNSLCILFFTTEPDECKMDYNDI